MIRNIFFLSTIFLLTLPFTVYGALENPLRSNITSAADLGEGLVRAIVYLVFPIAVLYIVYSGFLFITAQGNKDNLTKAKQNFKWVIIGVTLLLGAWALAVLIRGTIESILR